MEETTQHDPSESDPTGTGATESEEGKEPGMEFDPEQVENDPAYNPDDPGLKGLKGG